MQMALPAESGLSPSVPERGAPYRSRRRENFSGMVPARAFHPGHTIPDIHAGHRPQMIAARQTPQRGAVVAEITSAAPFQSE